MRMSPKFLSPCWAPLEPMGAPLSGDAHQIDVGVLLPDGGGLVELLLPGGGGEPGIERRLEVAGDAADARAVGHEAVGDPLRLVPDASRGRVEKLAVLQPLE